MGMQKHKDKPGIKGAFAPAGFVSISIWRYDTSWPTWRLIENSKTMESRRSRPASKAPTCLSSRTFFDPLYSGFDHSALAAQQQDER